MEDFDSVASGSSHDIPSHVMVERKMRMMRPAQFVHLSVGNMETGSLDQAMQIMTVAEAKGLGTNILILLHTWCVLRALDKSYEAEIYFDRACAIIATAERTYLENNVTVFEGSQLQVFAAYLVCIVHILKKNKSNFIKPIPNQQHSIAEAMLIEAMYIRHGHEPTLEDAVRWFGSCDTWIDVAETLRPTDFILLAEDAYWEAFIRNRHLNEPLIKTIEIKAESNRSVTALPFMLRALEVGRFNWFLRDFFRAVEGDERTEQIEDILDSFYIEDRAATKIQSVSRMRKHLMRFEIKKGELRAKKKAYNALVKKADMMGSYSVFRNAHRLYLIWREKARESREHKLFYLKRLKRYLQNHMVWLKYYRSNTRRAKMALKYISATQVNYDYTRIHYFHLWMYTLRMVELTRAANIIKFTLRQQKKEETLEWHLKTTTQIGFKRKAKTISKFMTHWRFRFEIKVRKRAAAIIRLIVRNVIRRHRLKLKMDKVEAAAAAVKKMIYSNTYQLMKRRWVKWQKIFKRNRKIWAVTALATHLPYILKKRCARLQFHSARRFVEIHDAVNYKHLYLNMESVFQLFYFLRSVYRIQRMIRLKIARINLRRRVKLICAVEDKWRECLISCRDRHWGQYKKYVVIWKETKEYSASIITLWWQRIHKSLKAVKARKHMKGSRLLAGSIYTMQTKRAFKRIGRSVAMIKQFISLNKMYAQLRIHYLRVAMTLFKEFDAYHKRIREIMHLTVHKKLGRIFYPGVHLSVHVSEPAIVPIFAGATNSIEASVEGPSIICQDIDKTSKTYEPFDHSRGGEIPYLLTVKEASCDCGLNVTSLEWEHYVKPRIFALRSMGDYAVLKSFQVMMATYRIRIRRLRSLSFMLAEHVSTHTLQQVSLRCASAHTIQRAWHCAAARIHLADRVRCARRLSELSRRLTALKPKRRRLFNIIKRGMFRRMAARLRLQAWVRMRLQTNTLMLMKINFTRLVNLEAFVHFKMKTNITRIILRHMLFNYGVRSSQLMLNPVDYPSSFGITVLADSTIDLLAPVISRGKGSIIKDPRGNKKMFSASVASLRTNSHGDVLEYGSHEMSISSRTLKNHNAISGLSQKGSVNIPGALKSFSSEVFHGHLFNVKRSNAIVLDQTKPMIQDDEIAYLAGVTDALFCQVGYRAGNHALKVAIKHFTGTKLVIFGGRVESKVANDLIFFLSYDSAPIRFSAVERLARSIAGATCKLTELSVDVTSVGVLGLLTILSSLRVNTSVKVMIIHFDKYFPNQWCIEKCFRYLALNKTLQGLYVYGMVLQQDTYLGLLSAVTEGLPNLSALEFEYEEEMSMAEPSNQFKDAIAKRELPIKVSIHAPSSMSVAAMKAGPDPPELFLSYGK